MTDEDIYRRLSEPVRGRPPSAEWTAGLDRARAEGRLQQAWKRFLDRMRPRDFAGAATWAAGDVLRAGGSDAEAREAGLGAAHDALAEAALRGEVIDRTEALALAGRGIESMCRTRFGVGDGAGG